MYDKDIIELEKIYKIFANKHRLSIIRFLKVKKISSVGAIADHLSSTFRSTSQNLKILTKVGILKSKYDGPFVMYSISENLPQNLEKIISLI